MVYLSTQIEVFHQHTLLLNHAPIEQHDLLAIYFKSPFWENPFDIGWFPIRFEMPSPWYIVRMRCIQMPTHLIYDCNHLLAKLQEHYIPPCPDEMTLLITV